MGHGESSDRRLRVAFTATGFAIWLAPILFGLAGGGFEGSLGPLAFVVAFAAIPYFFYVTSVRTRAGSIAGGIALVVVFAGLHLFVAVASARGDSQAGLAYIYAPVLGVLVVGAVEVVERIRLGRPPRDRG